MRIVDIREVVVPIPSTIRNAYIDLSKMTAGVIAVVTDVVRDGKPVVGYGFSTSNVVPHGGHQLSLNIAADLKLGGNESYPEVFAPFGGFADDTRVENGRITLPDVSGIGFEKKSVLIACLRQATET